MARLSPMPSNTKSVLVDSRELACRARTPFGLMTLSHHLNRRLREHLLEQQPEPQVLLLVDRDDQDRVVRVEQFLREQQPPLHEREPLRVAVQVVAST